MPVEPELYRSRSLPLIRDSVHSDSIDYVEHLEKLVHRYLKGDRQTCEELLRDPQHQQRVESIARKNTKGTSVSWEDAAQEAHEKVLLALKNGKFNTGGIREFYRWAATVAYHQIIDLVRQEKRRQGWWSWQSLDQQILGTDLPLGETIADDFDLWDAVERADLVLKAVEVISTIDRRYPNRGYLKLWQGRVQDRTQSQLAADLSVSQGEISKRWHELLGRIIEELGLLQIEEVKNLKATQKQKVRRRRSDVRW